MSKKQSEFLDIRNRSIILYKQNSKNNVGLNISLYLLKKKYAIWNSNLDIPPNVRQKHQNKFMREK